MTKWKQHNKLGEPVDIIPRSNFLLVPFIFVIFFSLVLRYPCGSASSRIAPFSVASAPVILAHFRRSRSVFGLRISPVVSIQIGPIKRPSRGYAGEMLAHPVPSHSEYRIPEVYTESLCSASAFVGPGALCSLRGSAVRLFLSFSRVCNFSGEIG